MRLTNLPQEFIAALPVLQQLQNHQFEAYFVGGSVRDVVLGQAIHDVDIATSAYPEEVKNIFPKTIDVGIEHGTVLVLCEEEQYEITTFRTESTYQDYRRPDQVTFVRSLAEDLKRRDFTINALAMDQTGEIVDLFDGLADLSAGILRAVGNPKERFHEDALRMMRGLRFASQLAFEIEVETLQAIADYHQLLGKISVERIAVELTKLLLGKDRQAGLRPFVTTECYQYCPGLRPFGEALLLVADLPDAVFTTAEQAWAVLLYHLHLSVAEQKTFLQKWKLSNQFMREVMALVAGFTLRLDHFWTPVEVYHLGAAIVEQVEASLGYFGQPVKMPETMQVVDSLAIHSRHDLAITGNDLLAHLQAKPGQWLGAMLTQLELAVVKQEVVNDKQRLLMAAQQLFEGGTQA